MTTAILERCKHCQSPYIYHPSFYGGDEINHPHNHHDYCQECFVAIKKALAEIPVKYEKRFVPTDKYTKEQIVTHQEERCKNGLQLRRILCGMQYVPGGTRHEIVCEFMPDEEWYMAEWWTHAPDVVSIRKETWIKI